MNNMVTVRKNKKVKFDDTVHNYLNPDYIYIPLKKGFELNIKDGDNIFKEDILLSSNQQNVYSPISGKVLGKTDSTKLNNLNIECIVIENDFKEKVNKKKGSIKYINEYSKKEMLELIKKYNACDKNLNVNCKTILINGIDSDPFEKTYSFIINTFGSKILETIDALTTILDVENTILAIKNSDSENVINLTNNIGTYPNINLKLMPDIYPIGYESVLVNNILNKKQISEGYLYLSVEDVYNIYNVLKRKKPITEKLITISGNAIEKTVVVNAKIGTSMNDLIKNCCEITNEKYYVVINGLIAGKTLTSLNNVVDYDTKSIFLNTRHEESERKCINCGLCNSKCPVGLNPKYIKEHKNADKSKCIHCGLCTYVCPSRINFKPYLGGNHEQ